MNLAIPFCISRSSVLQSRRVGYFLKFSVNFRLFAGQIHFPLSMKTLSYSPIESGTYNIWRVEFVKKKKNKKTKTTIQRTLWRNFIQRGLVVPIFIHSISLLFEGIASLKCVSGSSNITTVSGCYRKLNIHFYGAAWQKYHAPDT